MHAIFAGCFILAAKCCTGNSVLERKVHYDVNCSY